LNKPPFDPADVVYSPAESSRIGTQFLKQRRENKGLGVPLGLKSIDKDFIPAMPGELVVILGRPGNGKTGFKMRWARYRSKELKKIPDNKRVVVYTSWEQTIEDLHAFNVAAEQRLSITSMARGEISDDEWNRILKAGMTTLQFPLWFSGHSLERRAKRVILSIANLRAGLHYIEDQGNVIDSVYLDYLQRIPPEGNPESKTIAVSDNLDRLKEAAEEFACPFIVSAQAKREVDERDIPVPQSDDGQWTSNIEQTADKLFSLVRPAKYRKDGDEFDDITVNGSCQMLISLLKQKLGVANTKYWVYFDPVYNKLDELEKNRYNQREDI
jgi:replicative DNA helicase